MREWLIEFYRRVVLFGIILAVATVSLFILAFGVVKEESLWRPVFSAMGATLLSILTIRIFYEGFASRSLRESFQLLVDQGETGIYRVYPPGFRMDWLGAMRECAEVTSFGIRLSEFTSSQFMEYYEKALDQGKKITLILCDPRSQQMQERYYTGEPHGLPQDPQSALEDIAQRIVSFYTWKTKLNLPEKKRNFQVKLFPNYPTMSIHMFDSDLYLYVYPFRRRGFRSPILHFRDMNKSATKYYRDSLSLIEKNSVVMEDAIEDIKQKLTEGQFADKSGRLVTDTHEKAR